MQTEAKIVLLKMMLDSLELPDSAYEKAKARYDDLGAWLCRDDSKCVLHEPQVFSQGSFRLGTAIRPVEHDNYDLDLVCKFTGGISKDTHTQEEVKNLLGHEVKAYRSARGIQQEAEPKHRCWCLEYADEVSFHMDIVPCIPEAEKRRTAVYEAMVKFGATSYDARRASDTTVAVTDDRHHGYPSICDDWEISNPEGYAAWFETRMRLTPSDVLMKQAESYRAASIDELPAYRWKTPLQRTVQVLKRHRDLMFVRDKDREPISIIITTLAGLAYQGEPDVPSALEGVLSRMGSFVRTEVPRVPNPVDPGEDFADRWPMPRYKDLRLEENFWRWLQQAQRDFLATVGSQDARFVTGHVRQRFGVNLDEQDVAKRLGIAVGTATMMGQPKEHSISGPAKPWTGDEP